MDIPFSGRLKTIISCKSRQYGHCFYESVKRSNSLFKIVGSQLFLRITWEFYLVRALNSMEVMKITRKAKMVIILVNNV